MESAELQPIYDVKEARARAMKLSKDNPTLYYTLQACFGIFITGAKKLHVFAPSDSCHPYYFKNGQEKPFTKAQEIANQNATPTMS